MTDLPIPAGAHVPTIEQQERVRAAINAAGSVALGDLPIDEETARLIALPTDKRNDPEAVMRAAFATKLRNSGICQLRARGVALDENGKEIPQQ